LYPARSPINKQKEPILLERRPFVFVKANALDPVFNRFSWRRMPTCTVPVDRGAKPIRWWHYPLAVILPLLAAVPVVPAVILVRQWLGIELLSGA
jgi:hypothetical protein